MAPTGRDEQRLRDAKANLAQHCERLDKRLADRDYLCGEFSVADIAMFIFANTAVLLGAPPADGLANLEAWFERMTDRPAVGSELAAMQHYLAQTLSA